VLGSEKLRVVDGVKRTGGVEPRGAVWTPKAPAQEARLAALPRDARDSRMKIFSGTANRPLSQVGSLALFLPGRSVPYSLEENEFFC
jgi:ribose-phosphate pyrophosphokinase